MPFYNQDYRLIQDSAPIHKGNLTFTWLGENNIGVIDWPARSPNLNPMEIMWPVYSNGKQYSTIKELESANRTFDCITAIQTFTLIIIHTLREQHEEEHVIII